MAVVDAARAELPPSRGPRPRAARDPDRRRVLRRRRPGDPGRARRVARSGRAATGPGAKTLTAITSLAVAVVRGDVGGGGARSRARRSRATRCRAFDRGTFTCLPAAVLAMADPAEAEPRVAAHPARWPRARGSVLDAIGADLWGGLARDLDGRPGAGDRAARARDGGRDAVRQRRQRAHGATRRRSSRWRGSSAATVARAWEALRGRGDQSGPVRRRALLDDQPRRAAAGRRALRARSLAITDALEATRPPETAPAVVARGAPCVRVRPRGRGIVRPRHASRAKSWSLHGAARAPWVVGRALRQFGELTGDRAALQEAVTLLDATSARLERAKAHAALGNDALARELADRCGASRAALLRSGRRARPATRSSRGTRVACPSRLAEPSTSSPWTRMSRSMCSGAGMTRHSRPPPLPNCCRATATSPRTLPSCPRGDAIGAGRRPRIVAVKSRAARRDHQPIRMNSRGAAVAEAQRRPCRCTPRSSASAWSCVRPPSPAACRSRWRCGSFAEGAVAQRREHLAPEQRDRRVGAGSGPERHAVPLLAVNLSSLAQARLTAMWSGRPSIVTGSTAPSPS